MGSNPTSIFGWNSIRVIASNCPFGHSKLRLSSKRSFGRNLLSFILLIRCFHAIEQLIDGLRFLSEVSAFIIKCHDNKMGYLFIDF